MCELAAASKAPPAAVGGRSRRSAAAGPSAPAGVGCRARGRHRRRRRGRRDGRGSGHPRRKTCPKCINCKTCYQQVPELFEKTTIVVDGAATEVGRMIPGSARAHQGDAGARRKRRPGRGQLRLGDPPVSGASAGGDRWFRAAAHASRREPPASATTTSSSRSSSALLRRHLLSDPRSLRSVFIEDGMQAIAWEFQQDELGAAFTPHAVEPAAARRRHEHGADALPLVRAAQVQAASSSRALDAHLSDRYPMFPGCRRAGPARPASRRTSGRREEREQRLRAREPGLPRAT